MESGIFVWRGSSCGTNIFIKTTPTYIHTYIYIYICIHTLFYYYIYTHIHIHTFLFDKLYVYTHLIKKKNKKEKKEKRESLVSSIKIVAARYPSNSSIWDPINLYVGYILILPVWPQALLGSCLNKTLLSSVPLSFPSLHSCVSQCFSLHISFSPRIFSNQHLQCSPPPHFIVSP